MCAGVKALTLSHTLSHAGKTTNIPEGTAIIHSAVPLMTAEEVSPQLSTVWGTPFVAEGWMKAAAERCGKEGGGVPLGYSTVGGFTISDQLDWKSGFSLGGGGRADSGYRVIRLSGNLDNSIIGKREENLSQRLLISGNKNWMENNLEVRGCIAPHDSARKKHQHEICKRAVKRGHTYHQCFGWW